MCVIDLLLALLVIGAISSVLIFAATLFAVKMNWLPGVKIEELYFWRKK